MNVEPEHNTGVFMQEFFVNDPTGATLMLFVAIMVGIGLERTRASISKRQWRAKRGWSKRARPSGQIKVMPKHDLPETKLTNSASQLSTVMAAEFRPQRLLNSKELPVFMTAEKALNDLGSQWRLMAQVSLGEILKSDDKAAYWAINSKRVDMLIVKNDGMPLAVIEYQGSGHHLGEDAAARDAVKKEALRKAGIRYIEVAEGDTPAELKFKIAKLIPIPPKPKPQQPAWH
jgi:Protein of unknown function (DUF2726)